jgi:tetratricopeptide (TPR) repeat protein
LAADQKQQVTRLLKRGLNQYGRGDLEGAIRNWEQALVIDPENRAARDYLETANEEPKGAGAAAEPARSGGAPPRSAFDDEEDTPRTPFGPASMKLPESDEEPNTLVENALAAYKEGRMDQAWEALQVAAQHEPDRLDVQGYIAMMRSERARAFARQVGDQGRILRLKQTMQELMQLNLTPDEGFLLSQIDGSVTIEQLLNLSKDRVHTLQVLAKFIREGLVE